MYPVIPGFTPLVAHRLPLDLSRSADLLEAYGKAFPALKKRDGFKIQTVPDLAGNKWFVLYGKDGE